MTPLRQKMIEAMQLRGFSARTHESYLYAVEQLARYHHSSPDKLTPIQLQAFFKYLALERKLAPASCRLYLNGVRFFYLKVLGWEDFAVSIVVPKRPQRIPTLLSHAEVARLIAACPNPKHRLMLMSCYGCGLRVSELVALRVSDIDGERQLLRIEQGKGAKDRQVLIPSALLAQLRHYWRAQRPETWLFPSDQQPQRHLNVSTAQRVYHRAKARAGIDKHGGIHSLNGWVQLHPEVIYRLLFQCAWHTLKAFGRNPKRLGGQLGMSAVLHTWGQTLIQHVHLHCLVPGGVLTDEGRWKTSKGSYLFPVRALSRHFRGRMVSALRQRVEAGELSRVTRPGEIDRMFDALMQRDWVVYAKPCLNHTDSVIDYLARYTHRIAITNARILNVDEEGVALRYKDYADNNRTKTMHLEGQEFIRRYLLHLLPKGFTRIRHYGFLAGCCRSRRLAQIREALGVKQVQADEVGTALENETPDYRCPHCKIGWLILIGELLPGMARIPMKRRR